MPQFDVHLVGSIPFADAAEAFERVSRELGPALKRIPDGETGRRLEWVGWIDDIFRDHPDFEITGDELPSYAAGVPPMRRYRVRDGVDPAAVTFDLPHAAIALRSYAEFARLQRAGIVPARARFQFPLATPVSVVERYVIEAQREAVEAAYTAALFGEIARVAAAVPPDRLAVQWDVASAFFKTLQTGEPKRHGATRAEQLQTFTRILVRLGEAVPEGVELIYHFCYGSLGNRHSIEPIDSRDMVDMANAIAAAISRPIALIHMPVPVERTDDAYFRPLDDLKLQPGTELALGLVNFADGVVGTRRRIAAARRHVKDFAIATECGFGRYPLDQVPEVLAIHAELAGVQRP